jgi:hypothetical protein
MTVAGTMLEEKGGHNAMLNIITSPGNKLIIGCVHMLSSCGCSAAKV